MLACPRDLFVPAPHRPEALVDRPIRVEAAGFNISAPHVQALALQALALEPGQRCGGEVRGT
jgi:protein-L-isoaspartate O-methyltransferase